MPFDHHYGLILAGGRGTRFWPRSRRASSKQVLPFLSERSLIQETVDRLRPMLPPERLWILTNDHLRPEIIRQLPEIPAEQIIAEPAQRNTAPAIGLAAQILRSLDQDAVMGVFPSDHLILNPERYRQLLEPAWQAAEQGHIAVLGIQPRWPETGYGYIEFNPGTQPGRLSAEPVKRFREKPNAATAAGFVQAGHFFWNAGMFFWRVDTLLHELRAYLPVTAALLDALPPFRDLRFPEELSRLFPQAENISIDYAVMENAKNVYVLPATFDWNDLGTWGSLHEKLDKDEQNNAVVNAKVILENAHNNIIRSDAKKMIIIDGLDDFIIVDKEDVLLIYPKSKEQDIKRITAMAQSK